MVTLVWFSLNVSGSAMFRLASKLKGLKKYIRDFAKNNYSGIENREKMAHAQLLKAQEDMLHQPNRDHAARELEAHGKWSELARAVEAFHYQKSRITWLKQGDCSSSYFHRLAEARKTTNTILYLEDEDGTKYDSKEDIQNHCRDFYESLLGVEGVTQDMEQSDLNILMSKKCSADRGLWMEREVSEEEIKDGFFNLPSNKTPGPDGFTAEFFKSAWHIIGPEVLEAVKEFFSSGKLLKQLNETTLVLIPKVQNASNLNDFRPISCLNTVYKVISKILAARLQEVLPDLISPTQTAFISGRILAENVLLASEIVQGYNLTNISRRGMLKVDIRKAFDSVNWRFILMALRAMNIPLKIINWIEECITTPSFAVTLNGEVGQSFRSERGLRQGDPISPYLFVVAMDVFSRLLASRFKSGAIGYHPKTEALEISHLMFADDVMLFFNGTTHSLHGITEVLSDFASWSGMEANKNKTHLYIVGVEGGNEERAINDYGFPRGTLPIRYLGLPLMSRRLRVAEYEMLVRKIESRMQGWAGKALSFAGRVQLLKSVITGLINFWIQAFILPKACVAKIESLCARFLWYGSTEAKRGGKVCWKDVCLPREEGGLGIRRVTDWNKTLCLKLFWLIHSETDSLWVKWHLHHNLKDKSIWELKVSPRQSWTWRTLLNLRPLAEKFMRSSVRNGRRTSFWFDSWTPFGPLLKYLGEQGPIQMRISRDKKVINACNDEGWSVPRSRSIRGQALWDYLADKASPRDDLGSDIYGWWTQNALAYNFSARKTWEELRGRSNEKQWVDAVWFNGAIPSHAFTMWIAQLNRLPTRQRIHFWDNNASQDCVICSYHSETRDHLFLACPFASSLWDIILSRLTPEQGRFNSWSEMLSWAITSTSTAPKRLRKIVLQATIHFSWRQRNLKLHDNCILPTSAAFKALDKDIKRILMARRSRRKWKDLPLLWLR